MSLMQEFSYRSEEKRKAAGRYKIKQTLPTGLPLQGGKAFGVAEKDKGRNGRITIAGQ